MLKLSDLGKVMVRRDEGNVLRMYKCPAGYNTIGVGHNLDSRGISRRAAEVIFEDDCVDIVKDLDRLLPWLVEQEQVIIDAIIDMAFMGPAHLVASNPKMLAALKAGDRKEAARELLDGPYKSQVGDRAFRLAKQIETGEYQ